MLNIIWVGVGIILQYIFDRVLLSYKLRKALEKVREVEGRIDELEKKYLQGWHPDNICPQCFDGRLKIRTLPKGYIQHVCEKDCGFTSPAFFYKPHLK